MKFKKAFAVILAVAMVITLMPTMAFAGTTNSVIDKINTVGPEVDITSTIELKVGAEGIATGPFNMDIELNNAKWNLDPGQEKDVAFLAALDMRAYDGAGGQIVDLNGSQLISVNKISDTVVSLKIIADRPFEEDDYFRIKLPIETGTEDGDVNVTVSSDTDTITKTTLTVARVSSQMTTASVYDVVRVHERGNITTAPIEIKENTIDSITNNQLLKLTLPEGITWNGITVGGSLFSGNPANGVAIDSTGNPRYEANINNAVATIARYYLTDSGRTMMLCIPVTADNSLRQSITLTPDINLGKDADLGDITVDIVGVKAAANGNKISNEYDLLIAQYGEAGVEISTVDEEDLPEIVAGYSRDTKDKPFVVQVTLKEKVAESLMSGRFIDFEFPDDVEVSTIDEVRAYVGTGNATYTRLADDAAVDIDTDRSGFTMTVPANDTAFGGGSNWDTDKANTVTLFIPVVAKAGFTGDITLNVTGTRAGVEDTELVVGTVISPITVTADVTEVINGAQKQNMANITITENVPGYLATGTEMALDIDELGLGAVSFTNAEIAVTDGDLKVKNLDVDENGNGQITFDIRNKSKEVSTIEITGIQAALNRNLAEGSYDLEISGTAVSPLDQGAGIAASIPYLKVVTAADAESDSINAKFVVGESKYTSDDVEVAMDAASFIQNNRTYVPVRYVANACGVTDENISWSDQNRTVTLTGKDAVVTFTVGSNIIQTSSGTVTADVPVIIKDNRTYLPARFVANALGAEVAWDAATRTVTITK